MPPNIINPHKGGMTMKKKILTISLLLALTTALPAWAAQEAPYRFKP